MAKIAVVIGSVRPNRIGAQVAEWGAGEAATETILVHSRGPGGRPA